MDDAQEREGFRERDRDEDRESSRVRESSTERWRGGIDANLKYVADSIRTQGNQLERIGAQFDTHKIDVDRRFRELEIKVAGMAQRLAIYTGLGAFLGSGIMSGIFALVFKK